MTETGQALAVATTSITIGVLCLRLCLYFGLKYLWNIMNLIQYAIFMQMWLIAIPPTARIFMRELKALALLEFIPYSWLSGGDGNGDYGWSEEALVTEEVGIGRFGKNSIVSGFGSMLVIGIVLAIVILLAFILRVIAIYSTKLLKLFALIKAKLQYNSVLRFVL